MESLNFPEVRLWAGRVVSSRSCRISSLRVRLRPPRSLRISREFRSAGISGFPGRMDIDRCCCISQSAKSCLGLPDVTRSCRTSRGFRNYGIPGFLISPEVRPLRDHVVSPDMTLLVRIRLIFPNLPGIPKFCDFGILEFLNPRKCESWKMLLYSPIAPSLVMGFPMLTGLSGYLCISMKCGSRQSLSYISTIVKYFHFSSDVAWSFRMSRKFRNSAILEFRNSSEDGY